MRQPSRPPLRRRQTKRLRPHRRTARKPTGSPTQPLPERSPRSIGLTGGIGSGKSTALELFRELGAAVLSSDDAVHAIYRDPEVVDLVQARFGASVVGEDGTVDRPTLAERAFADPAGVADLEAIIHPRVGHVRRTWEARQRASDPPPPLLVCEVPLLFEAGLASSFDAVLVVTASEQVRRDRVAARGQNFEDRAARQIPEDDKIRLADRYVVNDGSVADLGRWVKERFQEYRI